MLVSVWKLGERVIHSHYKEAIINYSFKKKEVRWGKSIKSNKITIMAR